MPEPANHLRHDQPAEPDMILIPPGRFHMGSPDAEAGHEDNEYPVREVVISRAFFLGRFPVTFAQWDAFAASVGRRRVSDEGWGRERRPVINVSWNDAQSYVSWLRQQTGRPFRLPSEAEWEYAARSGTHTAYHWGDVASREQAHFFAEDDAAPPGTVHIGSFPPNRFGAHDMLGNVWEWVEDCWNEFYLQAPSDGSAWTSGDCGRRVLRGGSWQDVARQIRCASRNRNGVDFGCNDYGFRIASDI